MKIKGTFRPTTFRSTFVSLNVVVNIDTLIAHVRGWQLKTAFIIYRCFQNYEKYCLCGDFENSFRNTVKFNKFLL